MFIVNLSSLADRPFKNQSESVTYQWNRIVQGYQSETFVLDSLLLPLPNRLLTCVSRASCMSSPLPRFFLVFPFSFFRKKQSITILSPFLIAKRHHLSIHLLNYVQFIFHFSNFFIDEMFPVLRTSNNISGKNHQPHQMNSVLLCKLTFKYEES